VLLTAVVFHLNGQNDGDDKTYGFLTRQRDIHRELTAPLSPAHKPASIMLQKESTKEEHTIEEPVEEPPKAVSAGPSALPEESGPSPEAVPEPAPQSPPEPNRETPPGPPPSTEPAPAEQPRPAPVQPATTVLEKDQVYAVLGDSVTVTLKGEGWIYLGERDRKEGITFLTRESSPNSTDFLFQVDRKNSYELAFQLQKSSTAETLIKQVGIEVVSKEEFSRYIGSGPDNSFYKPGETEKADYSVAHRLYENERYREALEEYKNQYVPGDPEIGPEIADRIATLSLTFDKYNDALRFWDQNMETEGEYRDRAVAGTISVAIAIGDETLFHSNIEDFLSIENVPIEKQLLEAALFAEENELNNTAITLLEEYIDRYPRSRTVDLAYFTLGRIYEKKSSIQDVKQAINYYTKIIENFPASEYWITAEERKEYLDRHFLHIR
jgi:hypothetical protein